jgi:hypothetical protein
MVAGLRQRKMPTGLAHGTYRAHGAVIDSAALQHNNRANRKHRRAIRPIKTD